MCVKACPSLKPKCKNNSKPDCYAALADDDIREKSSSGGVFTLLAQYILNKGGYVCGASFDDKWNVHHIVINSKKDLEKLKGSKYVQSDMGKCYSEIKKLLDNDKYVLFSGCPCQVAGLYSFLNGKYEKLYTVDILCHGVPSRKVWQKYLEENFKDNIANINFRDKSKIGWSCSHCTITTKDNKKIVSDDYTKLFHDSIILRKSCENCSYSKLPRPADITLGDFWGISEYDKNLNDGKGVSIVLINSKKGDFVFKKLNFKSTPSKINIKDNYNNGHIRKGLILNKLREKFFDSFNKLSFNKSLNKVYDKYDVCVLCAFYASNYGSMLVSFACYKIIESLGYLVLMLQKPRNIWDDKTYGDTIPQNFAKKYYNISRIYSDMDDMRNLNKHCDNFVVGSDQLWTYEVARSMNDYVYMEWVNPNKNKIAFGTSFGKEKYIAGESRILKLQYLYDRFNHIALRETCSKICDEIFKIDAVEIIDPTLILPLKEYEKLADSVNMKIKKPYLLTYTLDLSKEKAQAIKYTAQKLGLNIINIYNLLHYERRAQDQLKWDRDYTPEEFLNLYKNASFVITDSYHGTCFSVKFNKPFISFKNKGRGELRYKVFDDLKVSHHIIDDINDVYNKEELFEDINYTQTNKIIKKKAQFATSWLDSAIKNNTFDKKFTHFENYMNVKMGEAEADLAKVKDINEKLKLYCLKDIIFKKYYYYKIKSKLFIRKHTKEHYKAKAEKLHNKVRLIRALKKELQL